MGKNIEQVRKRYGDFDYSWESNEPGDSEVGYYLYHDDGFMADYQDHYLIINYNQYGVVTDVLDGNGRNDQ